MNRLDCNPMTADFVLDALAQPLYARQLEKDAVV